MAIAVTDPLAAARDLAPVLREAGPRIEEGRALPPEIVQAMREAGLFCLAVPRSYGGLETDPVTASRVVEEVSAADGSAGWCVMLAAQAGLFTGFIPPEAARAVFEPGGVFAGVARPMGRAVPVEGGYTVSGRWPFASGATYATHFTGEALIYEDGGDTPAKDEEGNDRVVAFFLPRQAVTVHDTWDATGLRGTASHDFEVEGASVPHSHVFNFGAPPQHDWVLFRCGGLIFMNHGAQALGLARAALDAARETFRTKRGWGGVPLQEVGRVQETFAVATARFEAAKGYYYDSAEALWEDVQASAGEGGGEGDPVLRARVRLAASHAATESLTVVDLLHRALATTAIRRQDPLERIFRDLHTACAHVMVGPLIYEASGRVLLGRDADFPLF